MVRPRRFSLMKNFVKRILLSGLKTYFYIRSTEFVWRVLNVGWYGRGHAVRNAESGLNTDEARKVLDSLARSGFAVTRLADLIPGADFQKLQACFEKTRLRATPVPKAFLLSCWNMDTGADDRAPFDEIIQRLGALADRYFGFPAQYFHSSLQVTLPVGDKNPEKSQRWHRDPEDKRVLKVFLYLNDVDESAGPFVYVRESRHGLKYGNVFPQRPPIGRYPPKEEVEKRIDPRDIAVGTGKAGTLVFADTTGLHYGGYAREKERVMFTAGWRSYASPFPLLVPGPDDRLRFTRKLLALHDRWNRPFLVAEGELVEHY